jgi:hypothetical protein
MKRGRTSISALALVPPLTSGQSLRPPADLTAAERALFVDLVAGAPAGHFLPCDAPMLSAYVQVLLLIKQATSPAQKLARIKLAATLATKLRLLPGSRIYASKAGRMGANYRAPSGYDLMERDSDEAGDA